jgi:hypothetical protein
MRLYDVGNEYEQRSDDTQRMHLIDHHAECLGVEISAVIV